MKLILQAMVGILARLTLRRYTPTIIAITGSVGKTSTKEAVFDVVKWKGAARKSEFNYNNEIGVPLTILGIPYYGKNVFLWLGAFARTVFRLIICDRTFPKIFVLEMGADRPGDIAYLMRIAPPHIGIITAIGEIPVHVEFFSGPKEIAKEKSKLIKALSTDGTAILNADDDVLTDMRTETSGRIMTFGLDEHATVRISNISLATDYSKDAGRDVPEGTAFNLSHEGKAVAFKLPGAFGKPQVYAAAAAAAAGIALGMTLLEISKALSSYSPPPGRLRLLKGIKHSYILDDSYNSSPYALHAALDTLRDLPSTRKIAVLGDMLELGEYTESAHRMAGDHAARIADILITVGPRAKFIAEEAMSGGLENRKVLKPASVYSFDTSDEAGKMVDPLIQPGDLILVKGSQGIRMEKITEEIMAEPLQAPELLARQSEYWKKKM